MANEDRFKALRRSLRRRSVTVAALLGAAVIAFAAGYWLSGVEPRSGTELGVSVVSALRAHLLPGAILLLSSVLIACIYLARSFEPLVSLSSSIGGKALRESERRYHSLVEDQTDLICRFDPGGVLTFVNGAFCRYFGKPRDELEGTIFIPLIPDEDRTRIDASFSQLSVDDPVCTYEHRVILPNGETRWQRCTDRILVGDDGAVAEFQRIGRDVTEHKATNAALREALEELSSKEAEAAIGNLTAEVGHELRNPLGAIQASIYVIRRRATEDDELVMRAVDRVERGVARCDRIIDRMLGAARSVEERV